MDIVFLDIRIHYCVSKASYYVDSNTLTVCVSLLHERFSLRSQHIITFLQKNCESLAAVHCHTTVDILAECIKACSFLCAISFKQLVDVGRTQLTGVLHSGTHFSTESTEAMQAVLLRSTTYWCSLEANLHLH